MNAPPNLPANPYEQLLAEAEGRPFAAIVGWPVEHSRSPALHGYWLKQHRIEGHYGRLPVEPKRAALEELVAFLRRTPNARGCNLTLPHKIEIMPLLDRIDPLAARIGAVNTVIKQADGTLEGRNSDGFGFLAALRESAPDWTAEAGPVVVLGAGGAARAVVASLVDAGVPELRLLNRTQDSAVKLGLAFTPGGGRRIAIERWDERSAALEDATLLVNTTALGMKGQPPLDIDLGRLPQGAAVDDIVYIPLETPLLAAARARGLRTVDGLGMLLHQGRMGFEAWFGTTVKVSAEQRRAVAADLGA
ncbi:MAG: shikimate dehydrogenase [Reyranella sp.]|nr:shikimate dehydrogenase [Reyranella sp.]